MKSTKPIVYVVDDDLSVCRALSVLLTANGFWVETFNRPEDFLAFKHPHLTACLVLDIRMPKFSGFELSEIMAQRKIEVPVIFITGHGDIPMSVKAMKAGAIDFLPKPFTQKQLLAAITLALIRSKKQNLEKSQIARIKGRIKTLSVRELEVFRFVALGMLSKQIAFKRGTSLQTIKVHRSRVMQKMDAKTVTELIAFAQKAGIVSLPQ